MVSNYLNIPNWLSALVIRAHFRRAFIHTNAWSTETFSRRRVYHRKKLSIPDWKWEGRYWRCTKRWLSINMFILHSTFIQHGKASAGTFGKDLYKLLSNAVYGKVIEQLCKHMHVKLILDPKEAKCNIWKPTCQSFQIINEDLTMVHLGTQRIKMRKPCHVTAYMERRVRSMTNTKLWFYNVM